jgi:hypothetical protein
VWAAAPERSEAGAQPNANREHGVVVEALHQRARPDIEAEVHSSDQ